MAMGIRASGTWAELTTSGSVTIPGTPQAGDRMYLFATWKTYSVTASVSGWTAVGSEYADGTTASGNGVGSMKVRAWYRDWQSGDSNPTITFSGGVIAGAVIHVMSKGATEAWEDPTLVNGAMTNWTTSSQTFSANATTNLTFGDWVWGLVGIRDDSSTMTRPTAGIDTSSAITWLAAHTELPATHFSTTTGNDMSADLGYRVTQNVSPGDYTLRMTGTISAAETGAGLWVIQSVKTMALAQAVYDFYEDGTETGSTSLASATYYFDGSDNAVSDPNSVWVNDSNIADGSTSTYANTSTIGSTSSNYITAGGTNAPSSGDTIYSVRARVHAAGDGLLQPTGAVYIYTDSFGELLGTAPALSSGGAPGSWNSYVTLSAPSGGWTWAKLQALEFKAAALTGTDFTLEISRVELDVRTQLSRTVTADSNLGLRVVLQETSGSVVGAFPSTDDYALQYSVNGGSYVNVGSSMVETYYFDASDDSPSDPNGVWLNDANGFDGSTATSTSTSANSASTSTNYLMAGGTNAPSSGRTISQVRVRMHSAFSTGNLNSATVYTDGLAEELGTAVGGQAAYGSYATLSTPTGGWTWAKVQALEVKVFKNINNTELFPSFTRVEVEVSTGLAVDVYSSSNLTDGGATTNRMEDTSMAFVAGKVSEDGEVNDLSIPANRFTELLYSITLKHGVVANADTIDFRVVRNAATTGITYTSVPRIVVATGNPQYTKTHTTDALKRKQSTVTHTTDAFKRSTGTRTHTTDANKRLSGATRTHTTSSFLRAPAHQLNDNFNDNSIDTSKWNPFNTPVETGGQLQITSGTSSVYRGLTSIGTGYDLTGSYVSIEVVNAGNQALTSWEVYPVNLYTSGNVSGLFWLISNGNVYAYQRVSSSNTALASAAYNSTNHRFLRIREASGTTYWENSSDGITWNTFHSVANPVNVTAFIIEPVAGNWGAEGSTTTAIFDNLNVVQPTKTHTTDANKKKSGTTASHTTDSLKRKATTISHTTSSVAHGRDRYWVGNGGNWTDTAHWSLTSGGAGGASVPDVDDGTSAIFDANSFSTTGQSVVFTSGSGSVINMTWAGVTNTPDFDWNGGTLYVYGQELTFSTDMSFTGVDISNIELFADDAGEMNITTGGNTMPNTIGYGSAARDFALLDNWNGYSLDLSNYAVSGSTFTSNSHNIDVEFQLYFGNFDTITLGTSLIFAETVDFDYQGTGTSTLSASSATVIINGGGYYYADSSHVLGTLAVGTNLSPLIYAYGTTVNSLLLSPGTSLKFGTSGTLNVGAMTAAGTSGSPITIRSQTDGVQATISQTTGTVEGAYLNIQDSNVTGGAKFRAGTGSVNNGNNTGWAWEFTKTHTTDTLKRKQAILSHTADSFKRTQNTLSHTTNANKKLSGVTVSHTTSANKRVAGVTKTHSTDTLKRKQSTLSHSTDAYTQPTVQTLTRTHTTDAIKRKQVTVSHSTDAVLRKQSTVAHTTDSLVRKSVAVVHTTDANKKKASNTLAHTTSANKRLATTVSHTTSANKRVAGITRTHTTDSFLRRQVTASHTTDALKRKAVTVSHTTSANKRVATTKTHTTSAYVTKPQYTKTHTADAYKTPGTVITQYSFYPSASSDDAGENSAGTVTIADTTNVFNYQNHIGIRFNSINLPQGTTIVGAYYKPSLNNYTGVGTINGNIYFEDVDNSSAYTTTANSITSRSRTTATVANPAATGVWETANGGKGMDVTSLVQEVLDRGGWSSGNSMSILLIGNGNSSASNSITPYQWDYFSGNQRGRLLIEVATVNARTFAKGHTTDSYLTVATPSYTVAHTTDSLKRKQATASHTTDANKKVSGTTVSHTTSSNKRVAGNLLAHTTDAVKRSINTLTHTTDTLKRITGALSHTTDAFRRIRVSLAHTTDSFLRKARTLAHTTDSLLRKEVAKNHTTDANKKKANNSLSHATNALKRTQGTLAHSTDALRRLSVSQSHNTDSFLRKQVVKTHATDALLRRQVAISHTTSSNKKKADNVVAHTTDTLKRTLNVLSHTTDTLKKVRVALSHTADAFAHYLVTKVHTADAFLRKQNTASHETDSFLRGATQLTHTTNANKKKSGITVSHSTDSNKRVANITLVHTTSSNKRRADNLLTHATDAFLRKANTLYHTTGAVLRKLFTKNHTTDSFLRTENTKVHTTDANKRKVTTKSHTADAFLRSGTGIFHVTDTLRRKQTTVSHSTDASKTIVYTVAHATNALLRKASAVVHTTSAVVRKSVTVAHLTDAFLRARKTLVHTTSAVVRKANSVAHTTNANKRKTGTAYHTTSANFRKVNTLSHSTDSFLKERYIIVHSTDAQLRKVVTVLHATSANKRRAKEIAHSTNALLGSPVGVGHTTDANLYTFKGTKRVLVDGEWVYGFVFYLDGGTWKEAKIYYKDADDNWVEVLS